LDLWALTDALKRVAVNARENQLSASELTGGTFTVTSLGMFGVDEFSAIINPPEAAILAVGAIVDSPVIENGAIVPGKMLTLTLSVDHRIVDGALAGRFMQTVREELEEPLRLLTPII
jgi:pyruvate dehydrogenase E2 component (dihydrolipoamide acetyltransferase)